jgi:hypothetical protein
VQGQTSWYGRFSSGPASLKTLTVTYTGSSSLACNQVVSVYSWTTGTWVALDSRQVGMSLATITATPSGALANYVSNTTGSGDVAVRVACSRSDLAGYYTNADLLRIQYTP